MIVKRLLLSIGLASISAALIFPDTGAPDSDIGRPPALIAATQVVPDDPPPQTCCTLDKPPGAPGCIPGMYWDIYSQICRRVPRMPFVPPNVG